jgi:hypothetical protein
MSRKAEPKAVSQAGPRDDVGYHQSKFFSDSLEHPVTSRTVTAATAPGLSLHVNKGLGSSTNNNRH